VSGDSCRARDVLGDGARRQITLQLLLLQSDSSRAPPQRTVCYRIDLWKIKLVLLVLSSGEFMPEMPYYFS
jgi:hypothetical protein